MLEEEEEVQPVDNEINLALRKNFIVGDKIKYAVKFNGVKSKIIPYNPSLPISEYADAFIQVVNTGLL